MGKINNRIGFSIYSLLELPPSTGKGSWGLFLTDHDMEKRAYAYGSDLGECISKFNCTISFDTDVYKHKKYMIFRDLNMYLRYGESGDNSSWYEPTLSKELFGKNVQIKRCFIGMDYIDGFNHWPHFYLKIPANNIRCELFDRKI